MTVPAALLDNLSAFDVPLIVAMLPPPINPLTLRPGRGIRQAMIGGAMAAAVMDGVERSPASAEIGYVREVEGGEVRSVVVFSVARIKRALAEAGFE